MNVLPTLKWEDYMTQDIYLVVHHLFYMFTKYDDHGEPMTYHGISKQVQAIFTNIVRGVDAQVTPHSAVTYKQIYEKFSSELEQSNLVAQTFSPLGKPMPFFVPHQIHSHTSEQNVLKSSNPINVQDIESV